DSVMEMGSLSGSKEPSFTLAAPWHWASAETVTFLHLATGGRLAGRQVKCALALATQPQALVAKSVTVPDSGCVQGRQAVAPVASTAPSPFRPQPRVASPPAPVEPLPSKQTWPPTVPVWSEPGFAITWFGSQTGVPTASVSSSALCQPGVPPASS